MAVMEPDRVVQHVSARSFLARLLFGCSYWCWCLTGALPRGNAVVHGVQSGIRLGSETISSKVLWNYSCWLPAGGNTDEPKVHTPTHRAASEEITSANF